MHVHVYLNNNSSEHNSVPIDQLWGEVAYVPKQQKNAKPTPKIPESVMQTQLVPDIRNR